MSNDIICDIVNKRRERLKNSGVTFGVNVGEKRNKPVLPFPLSRGVILEIKRASPSKGDIAPNMDIAKQASIYQESGAVGISILTEMDYFHGGLNDIIVVSNTAPRVPILRKDFLLEVEEIYVSYNVGADAVLLIARILEIDILLAMLKECKRLGIKALLEIRLEEDLTKLQIVLKDFPDIIIVGVNARDLSDFSIDALLPCVMYNKIKKIATLYSTTLPIIYESGINTKEAAGSVSSMGFDAILVGEAVARNVGLAKDMASAFRKILPNRAGAFWNKYALLLARNIKRNYRPMVKICGVTNVDDAIMCAKLGANLLGFVFAKGRKRCTTKDIVKQCRDILKEQYKDAMPLLVAVITDVDNNEGKAALELATEGIIDVVQFHGNIALSMPLLCDSNYGNIARYAAINVEKESDLELLDDLQKKGQMRVLLDSVANGLQGGTGTVINKNILQKATKYKHLWLAGGITTENIEEIIKNYSPELIDISSGVEKTIGIKDSDKIYTLMTKITNICGAKS